MKGCPVRLGPRESGQELPRSVPWPPHCPTCSWKPGAECISWSPSLALVKTQSLNKTHVDNRSVPEQTAARHRGARRTLLTPDGAVDTGALQVPSSGRNVKSVRTSVHNQCASRAQCCSQKPEPPSNDLKLFFCAALLGNVVFSEFSGFFSLLTLLQRLPVHLLILILFRPPLHSCLSVHLKKKIIVHEGAVLLHGDKRAASC